MNLDNQCGKSLEMISKHLQNVLDELAIITAEIEEMKTQRDTSPG